MIEAEVIPLTLREPCPFFGSLMRIVEIFRRRQKTGVTRIITKAGRTTRRMSSNMAPTSCFQLFDVMPCMIGNCDLSLARAGPIIDALTEKQFLVIHEGDRHPLRSATWSTYCEDLRRQCIGFSGGKADAVRAEYHA